MSVTPSPLIDVPVNVLDLAPKRAGGSNAEAIFGSVSLARRAEQLGYSRFWVAEHHAMPAVAASAPAVLIAGIAAATERIRVGSGGVMLPNHAPLVVAEQFGTLRALYGDRIDLGIGRAPGTDGPVAAALRRSPAGGDADDFPRQLDELMGFFHGTPSDADPQDGPAAVVAVPGFGDAPEIWLLGSSEVSARLAGSLGVRFAFAHHLASGRTEASLAAYRETFRSSEHLDEPYVMVGVNLVAADTDEEARLESLPASIGFLGLREGVRPQPVAVDAAAAYPFTDDDLGFIAQLNARQAVGDPEHVRGQLESLLDSTGADELMLQPTAATLQGRLNSLEIVARLREAA